MMISRDEMGVKPLYYQLKNHVLAFASEIKALKNFVSNEGFTYSQTIFDKEENKVIDQRLDAEALSRYLTFLWCPGISTPFKDIKKLGPGEYLTYGLDGNVKHKKWKNVKISKFKPKNKPSKKR